jgi:hypothetical protein
VTVGTIGIGPFRAIGVIVATSAARWLVIRGTFQHPTCVKQRQIGRRSGQLHLRL